MSAVFVKLALAATEASLLLAPLVTHSACVPVPPESARHQVVVKPRSDAPQSSSLELPITFERHAGDLEDMVKRRQIRVLVVPSRTAFFFDKGQPHGIDYEAFEEFQKFANQKLRTGILQINIAFIPVRAEQLERALLVGIGDVIAYPVIATPERGKQVLFTSPIYTGVKQVVVTGPKAPAVTSLDDLSGKEIYVNPLTDYFENLNHLSESFQRAGRPAIVVKSADPNLTDEDLLEMVSAGLLRRP